MKTKFGFRFLAAIAPFDVAAAAAAKTALPNKVLRENPLFQFVIPSLSFDILNCSCRFIAALF
ncbi:MAG: hypothetical protein R3E04_00590 [Sphingobium sp.]